MNLCGSLTHGSKIVGSIKIFRNLTGICTKMEYIMYRPIKCKTACLIRATYVVYGRHDMCTFTTDTYSSQGKKLPIGNTETEGYVTEEDESADTERSKRNAKRVMPFVTQPPLIRITQYSRGMCMKKRRSVG